MPTKKTKTRRFRKGGKSAPPKAPEVAFRKELLAVINEINKLFRETVAPVIKQDSAPINDSDYIRDGIVGDVTEKIAQIQLLLNLSGTDQKEAVGKFVGMIGRVNKLRSDNAIKVAGFELSPLSEIAASEGITNAIEAATAENMQLITNLGQDYLDKMQRAVLDNYLSGKFIGKGGLNKELQRLSGIAKNRAKLIARDQTAKITGVMNAIRSQAAGSEAFVWHTMKDRRVRGRKDGLYPNSKFDHWDREGKMYWWNRNKETKTMPDGTKINKVPADGLPGEAVNCRCFGESVFID